jgi:7-keto-8-aminopelargonate synthetase-like enzyme
MAREPHLRDRLWENVRRVRAGLQALGFKINPTESPIVSIEVGTAGQTIGLWRALLDAGLYTNLVLPPACKSDACMIRTSYSAAHSPEQISRALAIFAAVASLTASPAPGTTAPSSQSLPEAARSR